MFAFNLKARDRQVVSWHILETLNDLLGSSFISGYQAACIKNVIKYHGVNQFLSMLFCSSLLCSGVTSALALCWSCPSYDTWSQ